MARKPRTHAAIRAELDQWEQELDLHIEECAFCVNDPNEFCPHGAKIHDIMFMLLIELLAAEGEKMKAEKEARKQRKTGKKSHATARA